MQYNQILTIVRSLFPCKYLSSMKIKLLLCTVWGVWQRCIVWQRISASGKARFKRAFLFLDLYIPLIFFWIRQLYFKMQIEPSYAASAFAIGRAHAVQQWSFCSATVHAEVINSDPKVEHWRENTGLLRLHNVSRIIGYFESAHESVLANSQVLQKFTIVYPQSLIFISDWIQKEEWSMKWRK